MQDYVLKHTGHKQDQEGPHHIKNGKALKVRPIRHDSAKHYGHKQGYGAEHVHLIDQEINAA